MIKKIKRQKDKNVFKLKRDFVSILKSNDSHRSIALSFGLSTFISLMPTPGFCSITGLALIAVFKQINKLAMLIALALYNAVTIIPFYWMGLVVGGWIFGEPPVAMDEIEVTTLFVEYGFRFVIGTLVVVIPYSVASYFFALWLIDSIRKKRNMVS